MTDQAENHLDLETIFAATSGSVHVKTYRSGAIVLGLSTGWAEGWPEIEIRLTQLQKERLRAELCDAANEGGDQ